MKDLTNNRVSPLVCNNWRSGACKAACCSLLSGEPASSPIRRQRAQGLSTIFGKILRIDVDHPAGGLPYSVPADNPFVGAAAGRGEIFAYGLRNPFRFSFDRATGDLFIGDVGQALFEEIDVQPAASRGGENYGWNVMEGLHCFNAATCNQAGLTRPVAEYPHDGGNCSVTGGFVYRGARLPALRGIYLYADFCSGRIWGLRRNGAVWENGLLLTTALQISSFGEDEADDIYVADLGGGDIYRVDTP
jgi:glucose/arabinose dehydrogenase